MQPGTKKKLLLGLGLVVVAGAWWWFKGGGDLTATLASLNGRYYGSSLPAGLKTVGTALVNGVDTSRGIAQVYQDAKGVYYAQNPNNGNVLVYT